MDSLRLVWLHDREGSGKGKRDLSGQAMQVANATDRLCAYLPCSGAGKKMTQRTVAQRNFMASTNVMSSGGVAKKSGDTAQPWYHPCNHERKEHM